MENIKKLATLPRKLPSNGSHLARRSWRLTPDTFQLLRDMGLERVDSSGYLCCQASEIRRTSVAVMCGTSERRGYHVVQVNHDARGIPVSQQFPPVFRCKLSGTQKTSKNSIVLGATCNDDLLKRSCVNRQQCVEFGSVLLCRPCWGVGNKSLCWNGNHVASLLVLFGNAV